MEQRQSWMREYLIELGQEPLAFVHSARLEDEPKQIAENIRRLLKLPELWESENKTWTDALKNLEIAADNAGIIVTVNGVVGNSTSRKLDPYEFRGFVLIDEFAPLIFINGADGKAAQMFTLAHELAHVWFGSSAIFDLRNLQPARDETEHACNLVAAEFLVPETELRKIWRSVQKETDRFQMIARHFKVSEIVAARRVLDTHEITREEFINFYRKHMDDWLSAPQKQGGGDFYANQKYRIGRRFGESVVRAARDGKLLYRDAYRLTGLYGKTFDNFAKSLGLGSQ
jgi:Zn-dependent peptidase ImmA (M78 family)